MSGIPVDYDPFADGEVAATAPTTAAQIEIWTASQLGDEASLAFNESVSLRFTASTNVNRLPASGCGGSASGPPNTGFTTTRGRTALTCSVRVATLSAGFASRSLLAVAVIDCGPLPETRTAKTTLLLAPFGM